jgi:hypothetical protein
VLVGVGVITVAEVATHQFHVASSLRPFER